MLIVTVEPRPIVLRRALDHIVEQADLGVAVTIDVPDDLAVVVDPLVLDRVVSNLVINAVRYGAPPILVEAERHDRRLRITVKDAGPGVTDEVRPRLFERFARGSSATGSGLGLAISHRLARHAGGELSLVRSDSSGTVFRLNLPSLA
jgi:two-component system sensor histidine kinase MtrB